MNKLPECPRYVAHPQSVWFNEHWRPIIERLKAENEILQGENAGKAIQISGMGLKINMDYEQITKLTLQRDTLKKCAEFYADKNNWLREKDGWRHDMIVKDLDDESLTDWEKRFSGKTARKALQEAEGIE